jgi:hypothetical protein
MSGIDWEAIRAKTAEKPRNPNWPEESKTGLLVKDSDGREYELTVRTWPSDGRRTIHIAGYWEYDPAYALQPERLAAAEDKRLCVDMGRGISIDEAGTAVIFELAEQLRSGG